jgi:hypothetical protein
LKTWATIDIANIGRATITEEVRMSLLQSNGGRRNRR